MPGYQLWSIGKPSRQNVLLVTTCGLIDAPAHLTVRSVCQLPYGAGGDVRPAVLYGPRVSVSTAQVVVP